MLHWELRRIAFRFGTCNEAREKAAEIRERDASEPHAILKIYQRRPKVSGKMLVSTFLVKA